MSYAESPRSSAVRNNSTSKGPISKLSTKYRAGSNTQPKSPGRMKVIAKKESSDESDGSDEEDQATSNTKLNAQPADSLNEMDWTTEEQDAGVLN